MISMDLECPFRDQIGHHKDIKLKTEMQLLYRVLSGDRKRSEDRYRCPECGYEATFSDLNRQDMTRLEYYNEKFNLEEKLIGDATTGKFTSELVKMKTPK
jgi:hypothetical protein